MVASHGLTTTALILTSASVQQPHASDSAALMATSNSGERSRRVCTHTRTTDG